MDEDPIQTARRISRRKARRLCLTCGRKLPIERHHVEGRNHDPDFTADLCQACHALVTEKLRRAGADMKRQPNAAQRRKNQLKAGSVFLHEFADTLWQLSEEE